TDDDRDARAARRRNEGVVALPLDGDDALALVDQLFDDAKTDIAESADDDVSALRDAPDLERAAELGADEVVGKDGGERRHQGHAEQAQGADVGFLPATGGQLVATAHLRTRRDQADGAIERIDRRVLLHAVMEDEHADDDDGEQDARADLDRQIDLSDG